MLPMQDVDRAQKMVEHVNQRISCIVDALRIEYQNRMCKILQEELGPDEADELHDLAHWIDSMQQEAVMLLPQAEGCVVGLNGHWCCYVPEHRERDAMVIASSLKDAMVIIRQERFDQLKDQLQGELDA
jgi:hypothetical protein